MSEHKQGVVPRLRFPEFRDAGPWEKHSLADLENNGWIELGRGQVISQIDIKEHPGPYPVYSSSTKNDGLMGKYGRFMFDEELITWSIDGGGDFFYRPKHKFSVTNVCGYLRVYSSLLNNRFIAFQLQTLHASLTFDYQFKAHPSVIRKLYTIHVPSLLEQQKIADCLSSLDELIQLETQKLDALKAHKKGLMQQLFPREGETTPRLRFPEFRDAGPWEVKRLGEVYRLIPTKSFSRERLTYNSGAVRNIHYGDIHTKYHALFDIERERVPFIVGLENEFEDDCYCVPGDIVFADASEDLADIGKAIEVVNVGSEKVVAGLHTLHARQLANNLVVGFGCYLFQADSVRDQIRKQAQGAKVLGISASRLKLVRLLLPEKEEQQKIADCLSSLDELITLQAQKLDALKAHKKGLMQQLFPQEISA